MRSKRTERGQSALLAVIGLIILAIGMYTSYNLSRAVYEKIQLQNAADAAAYSLATAEARAFNFYAFANRAQVANYVQMMEAQSILSSATFVEGVTGWAGDYLKSYGDLFKKLSFGGVIQWLYELGVTLHGIGSGFETAYDGFERLVSGMDSWTPRFIQMQTAENQALHLVALLMTATTAMQIGDGARDLALQNDPDARLNLFSYALNIINMTGFLTAIDWDAAVPGSVSPDAKRLMAELSHAARVGSTAGREKFIVARPPLDYLDHIISSIRAPMTGDSRSARRARSALGGFLSHLEGIFPDFTGTAKLLTAESGLPELDDTGSADPERSALSQGDALTAKDTARDRGGFSIFPRWGDFASVISTSSTGQHCRYAGKPRHYGTWRRVGRLREQGQFACDEEAAGQHIWRGALGRGGIQPYVKFASGLDGFLDAERSSFRQPDVWIWLNKEPSKMGMGRAGSVDDLRFTMRQGGRLARLDARIGEDGLMGSGFADGINVISRAQVYYHRPGAWKEPPNFFNPFWAARLAPTNVFIKAVGGELGLGGDLGQILGDNILTH